MLRSFNCINLRCLVSDLDDMYSVKIRSLMFFGKATSKHLSIPHIETLMIKKANNDWIVLF